MTRPKSIKVFIKAQGQLCAFMWANVGPDGSVMMGFPSGGKEQIELVLDEELGELRPPTLLTAEEVHYPKVTFHPSGQFKLSVKMGKTSDAIDRATVSGPRLEDISDPRHMLEILIPRNLPAVTEQPTGRDIVIDASTAPAMPLRCTVSSMSHAKFQELANQRFVDTSVWEAVHELKSDNNVWVWTLRASRNDEVYSDRLRLFLYGPVKWGQRVAGVS